MVVVSVIFRSSTAGGRESCLLRESEVLGSQSRREGRVGSVTDFYRTSVPV